MMKLMERFRKKSPAPSRKFLFLTNWVKKGKENVVVDALSRNYDETSSLFSLSFPVPNWL